MPFKKGHSGNPGGRPKITGDIKTLCREHTDEAVRTLLAVMTDIEAAPAARALAANSILDRGYGKPMQHIETTVNFLDKLSHDERATVESILASLAGDEEDIAGRASATAH